MTRLDLRAVLGGHLVAQVLERPLGLVGQLLGLVAELDLLAPLLVLVRVALRLADHLVHVVLAEHGRGRDPDLLLLAGRPVLGLDVEDAVGVDVEGDLDLRDAARRRRDAVEDEPAERLVVGGEVALALEDVDLHLALVVGRGGEDLRLGGRDRRVAVDQAGHHAAQGLDAQGQRRDVEEEDVLDLAAEHAGLDRGADRHDLVRVDAAVRLLAEHALDRLRHGRHAGHAADEDDLVDVGRLQPGVLERREDRGLGLLDQVADEGLELGAAQRDHEVLGARGVGGDVGQVDLGGGGRGQLDLRLLRGLLEALQGLLVLREVHALVLLELGQQPVDDALVEVVAAQVRVAVGRLDLEHALARAPGSRCRRCRRPGRRRRSSRRASCPGRRPGRTPWAR